MNAVIFIIVVFVAFILVAKSKSTYSNVQTSRIDILISNIPQSLHTEVIKIIRAERGLGLAEAKEVVENSTKILLPDIDYNYAMQIKNKFERHGAIVAIKEKE